MTKEELKSQIKAEWDADNEKLSGKKETVFMKQAPILYAMRVFNSNEDYESQIMKECEAFFEKNNVYPNAIVMSPITFNYWYNIAQDSALETVVNNFLETPEIEEITNATEVPDIICEFKSSSDNKATLFATPKYELYIISNDDYQNGVYQLFSGYSSQLENGHFSYPLIDMIATGKNIKETADRMHITPKQIQNVCGLGSIQSVYKWFSGKSVPSIDNLGVISNLLNTTIDDLVIFTNRED